MSTSAQQIKEYIAGHFLDRSHALFLKHKNPVHAWNAYRLARHADVSVPAWVLEFLDSWADVLAGQREFQSAKQIADALGIGAKGGPVITRQAKIQARNFDVAGEVEMLKARPSASELRALAERFRFESTEPVAPGDRPLIEIFLDVAERFDLDVERVQAIYYGFTKGTRPRKLSKKKAR